MGSFDVLAGVTTRLASTARIDEIVETVVQDVAGLGFGAVWMATLDETGGTLTTVTSIIDGVDITRDVLQIPVHDVRRPIGKGFRDRRMVNVTDPDTVQRLDGDDDVVAPDRHALPRPVYDQLRGQPFACGPLFGRDGQPVGAVGLASYHGRQPIPDEVLANGAVRTFIDHLGFAVERARHVEQLTANLGKAQAAIAGDARVKALGELAIAVAHDLNNLAGVALMAASVGMRSSADAVDMLPRIERANRAIGDLVARLQRIARAPSGEAPVADPRQIVEDIAIMAKPLVRERSIELDTELDPVPAVRCDPVLLHQVVLNLVVNAHDALAAVPTERRRIRIRLRGDGGVVRLTVADTGPGIAPEVLARLFQPFVTTKRDAHLGLGLAAAQAALRGFGAQIAARNAPSGGAEFEVSLAVAPAVAAAPVREPPPAAAERRPARILAIDDDPDVVDIIRAYLEPVGHRVTTATASAEAIAAAAAQPFDLVLCDIGMPEQNGIDVCRALRNAGYRGKLVLMTGWDHYGATTGVAFDMLIKKPFVGAELLGVIDSALAG
jgi:signal transduction histidine kinase